MKTIFSLLLLVFLVSCSQTRPTKYKPLDVNAGKKIQPAAQSQPVAAQEPKEPGVSEAAKEAAAPAPETEEAGITNAPAVSAAPAANTNAPAAKPDIAKTIKTPPPRSSANAQMDEIIAAGMINFQATPLDQVLQIYAELVNRTILRPANLAAAQITLKTQTQLTKREAIQALDVVLGMNGIVIINVGEKFVKAVPAASAQQEGAAPDSRKGEELSEMGQYLYHVVQLKYVKPTEMMPVLQPFAKAPNSIMAVDSSSILVIRDYTENIKRMLEMIEKIDITVPAEFISEVIPIKYAKASDISSALNSLSGGGGGTTFGTRSSSGGTRPGSTLGGMQRPGGMGGTGLGSQSGMGSMGGTTPGGTGTGSSMTDRMRSIINKAATSVSGGDMQILGQTKIIADERANALLIFATRQDMEMIKNIVSKLDVVLAQVLIETVIMDVQIGKSWALGVSAGQYPKTNNSGSAIGGAYNNSGQSLGTLGDFFSNALSNNAAFPAPSDSTLQYFGRYKGDLAVTVAAMAGDSRVNVIQKPQILTSHATPGSIFVGSTVPYVTGSTYGGYSGYGNSYQQLQVGIGLQVTPYINQEGLVVMQIEESIDEISGSTAIQGVGNVPNTTKRTLSAEVAVRDGDTIILGGFIRNSDSKASSGVPILKDIPVLGALFTSKSSNKERKELLVLMRPTVLRTPELVAQATLEQKKMMPGIRSAEAEIQADERALMKSEMKKVNQQKAKDKKFNQKSSEE